MMMVVMMVMMVSRGNISSVEAALVCSGWSHRKRKIWRRVATCCTVTRYFLYTVSQ